MNIATQLARLLISLSFNELHTLQLQLLLIAHLSQLVLRMMMNSRSTRGREETRPREASKMMATQDLITNLHSISRFYLSSTLVFLLVLLQLTSNIIKINCHSSQMARSCPVGAPVQWRPYLDAPSKAYLSPAIVIGQLREVKLRSHPNDINSAGILFEASFVLSKILKSPLRIDLRPEETIRLLYRTSSSNPMMVTIAHESTLLANPIISANYRSLITKTSDCAFDLQDFDSLKFKLNKNYVLFLDQYEHSQFPKSLYPFALHERLTNQTSRALRRILSGE